MSDTSAGPEDPREQLDRQREALSRRLLSLTGQLSATDDARAESLKVVLEELGTATEELEVASEELHAQNEALTATKQQLDREARQYRQLFDFAPDGYLVTDDRGIVLEANHAVAELFGMPSELIVGKPVIAFVEQDHRKELLDQLSGVAGADDGAIRTLEVGFAPAGARAFAGSVRMARAATDPDEAMTVRWLIHDDTDRVEQEKARSLSEARYRLIADNATDVVITVGLDGEVTYASPSTERILGLDRRALVGVAASEFVHPADRSAVDSLQDEVVALGHHASAVCRVRLAGGGYLPMELHVGPLVEPGAGRVVGVQAALRDVREREESRSRLQAALTREREVLRDLREVEALKDTLLLAVAHDLRSPVAATAALAQLLAEQRESLGDDELEKVTSGIAASAEQASRILDDLLDFERLSGGRVAVNRHPTDLGALVAGVAGRRGLDEAQLTLPEGPVWATIDPGLTERIVDNLILNALLHTAPGTAVEVCLERSGDAVVISVDDEGQGIEEADREAIFEAFGRVAGNPQAGLGIGLHLVRRFAELQGGRAWVEESPSGGASFRVLLPVG